MKGEPSKNWEVLIENIRTKTADNFKTKVVEVVKEIMGEDVCVCVWLPVTDELL